MPPKHYPRARPLAEGETRTAEEPRVPELIWNGARITITDEQMKELAETGTLTLSRRATRLARQGRAGLVATSSSTRRRSTSRRRSTRRCSSTTCCGSTKRASARRQTDAPDLFADFNGIPTGRATDRVLPARPELVEPHDPRRLAAGDGQPRRARGPARQGAVHLLRPAVRHQVQLNFQWSTTSRDVKDGNADHITREPEQVKAFRDTWRDGIHCYLTYLRDRLTVARDLLDRVGLDLRADRRRECASRAGGDG